MKSMNQIKANLTIPVLDFGSKNYKEVKPFIQQKVTLPEWS